MMSKSILLLLIPYYSLRIAVESYWKSDGGMLKAILFDLDDTLIDWHGWSGDWVGVEQQHLRGVYDFLAASRQRIANQYLRRELGGGGRN